MVSGLAVSMFRVLVFVGGSGSMPGRCFGGGVNDFWASGFYMNLEP